jgi:TetR/AcrR family tetracycline transcriptional repressor
MGTGRTSAEVGSVEWWSERQARTARRRPRADGLTIERIIDAALAVVDRDGIDALTVRRLADELETGSASLYRHVASRSELLVLLADHVLGEVVFPPAELGGRPKVEWLSTELRRVLLAHPNLLLALRVAPLLGPNALRGAEHGMSYLLEMGVPAPDVARVCFALIDFVLGTVFFDTSTTGRAALVVDGAARPVAGRSAGDVPGPATDQREHPPPPANDVFRLGLTMFLDGLSRHYPPAG